MVPPWVMLPVGVGVGYLVGNWLGAIFGGVIGFFLWRSTGLIERLWLGSCSVAICCPEG